jgi:arylsulfatase A-like enzyme
MMVRWPGKIKPNQVSNEVISHQDWLPTLLAAAGDPDVKKSLKSGMRAGDAQYKVHLDGYNFLPYFTGGEKAGPRKEFIYTSDTGDIVGIRTGDYKVVFKEQRAHGAETWIDPWVSLRAPKLFNLRQDPLERMEHESENYYQWWAEHMFLFAPAMMQVAQFKATFKDFPQRQKPGAFVP